jgi:hypothetical protein
MADIKAMLIFEMLGKPAEHLKAILAQFIEKLGKEPGVQIINKTLNEPKRIDESTKEFYTTFAEIEANFKNIETLMDIIFSYMPSHVEVISPTELNVKNFEITSLMTGLALRLHKYDELTKLLAMERDSLKKKLQVINAPAIPEVTAPAAVNEDKKEKEIMEKSAKKSNKDSKSKKKK